MPDRLSDLLGTAREIASLVGTDAFHVLRPTDTTDDPDGSDYTIRFEDFLRAINAKYQVETILNPLSGEFDFATIPTGGKRLILPGYARSTVSATSDGVRAYLNADTTDANYHAQNSVAANGVASVSELSEPIVCSATGASSPSGAHVVFVMVLEGYDTPGLLKQWVTTYTANFAAGNIRTGVVGAVSSITDAITRIRIRTDNHATDTLTGEVSLYVEY